MSKVKGPTWAEVQDSFGRRELNPGAREVECRQYNVVGGHSTHGRSTVEFFCPFCRIHVEAFNWSLRGGGKRCDCGAMFGGTGNAYHWDTGQ